MSCRERSPPYSSSTWRTTSALPSRGMRNTASALAVSVWIPLTPFCTRPWKATCWRSCSFCASVALPSATNLNRRSSSLAEVSRTSSALYVSTADGIILPSAATNLDRNASEIPLSFALALISSKVTDLVLIPSASATPPTTAAASSVWNRDRLNASSGGLPATSPETWRVSMASPTCLVSCSSASGITLKRPIFSGSGSTPGLPCGTSWRPAFGALRVTEPTPPRMILSNNPATWVVSSMLGVPGSPDSSSICGASMASPGIGSTGAMGSDAI